MTRWILAWTLLLASTPAIAQVSPDALASTPADPLPDAPSTTLIAQQQSVVTLAKALPNKPPVTCRIAPWKHNKRFQPDSLQQAQWACINPLDPYERFLNTSVPIPMNSHQKAYLAFHNFTDPFNAATVVASSAFGIAINSHSGFGPGIRGTAYLTGVTYSQDGIGELFGTWLIPSLTHEDPHYRRLPNASFKRRVLHAASRTFIAQHDDGSLMPNYATLLTYPIAIELSNLYVPGVQTNGRATTSRIITGYATDPIGNIITEFLPDVAKRVHIRVLFLQRILNQVAAGQPGTE